MQLHAWSHEVPCRHTVSPTPRGPRCYTQERTLTTLTGATRIIAVAAAGILTSVLLSAVVSIAEPQRSALIAKKAAQPQAVAASAALRMADAH